MCKGGRGGHRERKRARELRDGAEETRGGEARKAGRVHLSPEPLRERSEKGTCMKSNGPNLPKMDGSYKPTGPRSTTNPKHKKCKDKRH